MNTTISNAGILGIQKGMSAMNKVSGQIARASGAEIQSSHMPTQSKGVTESLLELKKQSQLVEASVKVLKVDGEMTQSILDVIA